MVCGLYLNKSVLKNAHFDSNLTNGYISKRMKSGSVVPRSLQHYSQDMKITQMSSADEWIKKTLYIYTMEYYFLKRRTSSRM